MSDMSRLMRREIGEDHRATWSVECDGNDTKMHYLQVAESSSVCDLTRVVCAAIVSPLLESEDEI